MIKLSVFTTMLTYEGTLCYYVDTGILTLYDYTSDTEITLDSNSLIGNFGYEFTPVKLVLDLDKQRYDRVIIAGVEFDVTAYSISATVAAGQNYIDFGPQVLANAGLQGYLYIDYCIITVDEP